MRAEIDINKIVEKIDMNKLVEERIISDIEESSKLEDIIDNTLENDEIKNIINNKILKVIEEYLSSDEGKRYIIEGLERTITDSDILSDAKIVDLVASFLKKSLIERS